MPTKLVTRRTSPAQKGSRGASVAEANFVRLRTLLNLSQTTTLKSVRANYAAPLAKNARTQAKALGDVLRWLSSEELYGVLARTPREIERMAVPEEVRAHQNELTRICDEYLVALRGANVRVKKQWLFNFSENYLAHYYLYKGSDGNRTLLMRVETKLYNRLRACVRRLQQLETRRVRTALQGPQADLVPLTSVLKAVGSSVPDTFQLTSLPVCSSSGTPYTYRIPLEISFSGTASRVLNWGQLRQGAQAHKALKHPLPFKVWLRGAFRNGNRRTPELYVSRTELARRVVAHVASRQNRSKKKPK